MLSETPLVGLYNLWLVGISVAIAMVACYAALDLTDRVTYAQGKSRWIWLCGSATAMGIGIWSMHYVGMLAFKLPVPVFYYVPEVVASLFAAILASALGLYVISSAKTGLGRLIGASPFMGSGIVAMHYVGMEAMRLPAMCHYSMPLVILSIALAVIISFVALWLSFHFRGDASGFSWQKLCSAVVMGSAIPVMHYTGMAAVTFYRDGSVANIADSIDISTLGTLGVIVTTFMVLALALATSAVDRRFSAQAKELQQSEQHLRQLVESVQVVLWRRSAATKRFEFVNGEAKTLLGFETEEWLSHPDFWERHIHSEDRDRCEEACAKALSGVSIDPFEHRMITADGRVVWLRTSVRAVHPGNGQPELAGVMVDITGLKEAEEKSRIATQAAEMASRSKSEFLANVSHEIRTPMNGVLGMTELALSTELTDEQRYYLTLVKSSADGLLTVINDILDFSKVEAGKLEVQDASFDLSDMLFEMLMPLSLRADTKGIELACDIDPGVPDALVGDAGRIRQVLVNLLGNAIKFTERGEVVLRIIQEKRTTDSLSWLSPPSSSLVGGDQPLVRSEDRIALHFVVSDTGIGIPGEKLQSIFEPFSQVDGSATRIHGGTGLGLAICRKLVETMGGWIWVESVPNEGSEFHFTLTLSATREAAVDGGAPMYGLPVLVVDDNAATRCSLERRLLSWGTVPVFAASGEEGLAILEARSDSSRGVGLILVDAGMPGMSGFEFCAAVRRRRGLGTIPIVMLNWLSRREDAIHAKELGVVSCVSKPVDHRELQRAISAALADAGAKVSVNGRRIASSSAGYEAPNGTGRCLNILLTEDNHVNQKLATTLLRKYGHTVSVANNGIEAIAALEQASFDIVLMDVQMPGMDGFEATALIRQREAETGKRIPILAVTAHAMTGDRERCLEAGMDGYVSKPLRIDELLSALESFKQPTV